MQPNDHIYTDPELDNSEPLTQRDIAQIRRNAGLMRWSDGEVVPGSLADQFWNKDMPRLLALAEKVHLAALEKTSEGNPL